MVTNTKLQGKPTSLATGLGSGDLATKTTEDGPHHGLNEKKRKVIFFHPTRAKAGRALSLQPAEYQWGPSLLGTVRFNQIL